MMSIEVINDFPSTINPLKWGFLFYRVIRGKFLRYEEIIINQFNL